MGQIHVLAKKARCINSKIVHDFPKDYLKCTKSILTCKSLAGFQSMSYSKSREAPMRFKPTPPALELSRNTSKQGSKKMLLNGTCKKKAQGN